MNKIGFSTYNSLADVLSRVESRLGELGLSAHAASMAAGKPDAVRNLRRAVSNGDRRGLTTETLPALAPVRRTTAAWLLEGSGEGAPRSSVSVVGRIGAGAEILPEDEQVPPEGLRELEIDIPLPVGMIAFEVEGNSMWPRYNAGDVVLCRDAEHDPAAISGREAAVRTADGKRDQKTIRRGTAPETFDLESHNAPPIRDVTIAWASPIELIVPSPNARSTRGLIR